MPARLKPWHAAAILIVICAAVAGFARWRYESRTLDAAALVGCLQPDQAMHVYVDVAALRQSGILDLLAGSKAAEEQDYRHFVEQTGFDYRTDLDAVAAAFAHGDVFFAMRGRFDWRKLSGYAQAQGGFCRNAVCDMPASTPGRHISFYPIRSSVLALAVSASERGVEMIGPNQWPKPPQLPAEPVWISAPAFLFANTNGLPEGTHSFLSPLAQSQRTTFAIGPDGNRLRVRMEALCGTPEQAGAVAQQLTAATDLLRKMLDRENMTPNPRDLSAVLVAGKFEQQNNRVTGAWPVDRGFLEALASGAAQ